MHEDGGSSVVCNMLAREKKSTNLAVVGSGRGDLERHACEWGWKWEVGRGNETRGEVYTFGLCNGMDDVIFPAGEFPGLGNGKGHKLDFRYSGCLPGTQQ